MKTLIFKNVRSKIRSNSGLASVYLMLLLTAITVGSIAMMGMQMDGSSANKYEANKNAARSLALSGAQEAYYYVVKTSPGWTGTMAEQQIIDASGKSLGTYVASVSNSGSTYTLTTTGYYPNKSAPANNRVSYTTTKTFTYVTPVSRKGLVVVGTTTPTVVIAGHANLNLGGLGNLVIASSHGNALNTVTNAIVTADKIAIVGGKSAAGTITANEIQTGYTGDTSDPYAGTITLPTLAGVTATYGVQKIGVYTVSKGATVTVNPGVYEHNVTFSSSSNVTLADGVYWFAKSLTVNTGATMSCSSCTIFMAGGGSFNVSSGANVSVTAPTSGSQKGFVIMQPTANNSLTIHSYGGTGYNGVIYAPNAALTVALSGVLKLQGETNVFKSVNVLGSAAVTINPTVATGLPLP